MVTAERNGEGNWEVQNDYLRLHCDGRGVVVIDKRSGTEGRVRFGLPEGCRPASSASQAGDTASLILAANDWRARSSWHIWLTLTEGVASVAVKVAVFNRSFAPVGASPQVEVLPPENLGVVAIRHAAERFADGEAAGIAGSYFGSPDVLIAPQDTALLEGVVLPCSLGRIDFASVDIAARLDEDRIALQSAETRRGHRLLVAVDGRTMELQIDLLPDRAFEADLRSLGGKVERFQVRDPRGNVVLDSSEAHPDAVKLEPPTIRSIEGLLSDEPALAAAERDPGVSHAAALARGFLRMRAGRWAEAVEHIEDSLLRRGDNPLAWWAKNWCLREMDQANEHDLANAHFLAPMEPVLRADAVLSAPDDAKPLHLLDDWAGEPQPFLEVADLLDHAGLGFARASWLGLAREIAPCRLTELLIAAAHLNEGRELAAAEHVSFAKSVPDTAEAFRRSELEALQSLGARFPLG